MGYAFFRNIDATNYVEIGVQISTVFYAFAKLKAGEVAVVRHDFFGGPHLFNDYCLTLHVVRAVFHERFSKYLSF